MFFNTFYMKKIIKKYLFLYLLLGFGQGVSSGSQLTKEIVLGLEQDGVVLLRNIKI